MTNLGGFNSRAGGIKKAVLMLMLFYLPLSGMALALAAPPGVSSTPALFSVIKTDTSKNNNVEIIDHKMYFTPGKGIGDEIYGFQPGSRYYYEDLCRIKNDSKQTIQVGYRLTGGFADLYDRGAFWLEMGDACWAQSGVPLPDSPGEQGLLKWIKLEKSERSGPVNFSKPIHKLVYQQFTMQ